MRRALLALLLVSSSAQAATHYVTPVSSATWGESTSPATPCNLTTANANAVSGDVLQLYHGNYAATGQTIAPANHGTGGGRITYVGSLATPSAVVVAAVTLDGDSAVTVKGFSSTGTIAIKNQSDADSVTDFQQTGGVLEVNGGADNVVIARGVSSNTQVVLRCGATIDCAGSGIGDRPNNLLVTDCQFTITRNGSPGDAGLYVTGPLGLRWIGNRTFIENNSTGAGSFHFQIKHTFGAEFRNSYFYFSGTPLEYRVLALRDSTVGIAFRRDTLFSVATPTSATGGSMYLAYAGNTPALDWQRGFTMDSCYVSMNRDGAMDEGSIMLANRAHQYTFTNNVLENRGTAAVMTVPNTANSDTLTIRHNTFRLLGDGAAIWFEGTTPAGTVIHDSLRVSKNIFYADNIPAAGGGGRCDDRPIVVIRHFSGTVDTNLYYNRTSALSNVRYSISDSPCSGAYYIPGQSGTSWYTAGRDQNSRYGNPLLSDTSSTAIIRNYRPTSGTSADFGSDGFVGAVNPLSTPPIGDTDPPAQINDLSGAALGTDRVSIAWTASGDDGRSGVASNTYIRRHSSAISDESAWSAATPVATITTASNSTGGEQQSYQITGLTASTTYWIAVRSADEIPNTGGISNTISLTTSATPDTMPPSPVNNLTASALTSTSVQLTWTAPGGDRSVGRASTYLVRYRPGTTLTEAQWATATNIAVNPTPNTAGSVETWTVGGLSPSTTYTFALKTSDNVPNQSVISNGATVVTQGTPAAPPGPLASFNRRRRR